MGSLVYGQRDWDLHPQQIQPAHIVINSPWFRTEERSIWRKSIGHAPKIEPQKKKEILELVEQGLTTVEICKLTEVPHSTAYHYVTKYGRNK